MKKALLLISTIVLCINFSYAKDITQISVEDNPQYTISVTHGGEFIGVMKIQMFSEVATMHVRNFDSLVSIGFYNGTAFHRVIPNFMIQGGDPNSKDKPEDTWGYGDPSQTKIPAEFSSKNHLRGILSAARLDNDINSATSQFFICVASATHLDGLYSIYGEVLEGMDVADIIVNVPRNSSNNRPYQKVEMTITKVDPSNISESNSKNHGISIYPNPVNDIISFKSESENMMIKSYKISDINGNVILKSNNMMTSKIEDLLIPADDLPVGIYFIQLKDTNNQLFALKIVVN